MNEKKTSKFLLNPKFRVIITWIWFIIGAFFVIIILSAMYGFNFATTLDELQDKRFISVYIEIVSVGLLPVIYTIICKEKLSTYGIKSKGIKRSILFSSSFLVFFFIFTYLTTGNIINYELYDFQLNFPWNIYYGILGIFAWGPLEMFFFTWLIVNTDEVFNSESRKISYGLIVTTFIFALAHILTTRNVFTAFYTGLIFFILGLIFKYTDNSIGPVIAWTLINNQVWFIAQMIWML